MTALLGAVFVKPHPAQAQPAQKPNLQQEFKALQYKTMPYRLLIPENYDKKKRYPLVLFLHGYGERGSDNAKQLRNCVGLFARPDVKRKYPCFVVVPQTPGAWIAFPDPAVKPIPKPKKIPAPSALALEILTTVEKEYSVDRSRIYLSGFSNGACAVWCLLEHDPKRFAAAVPLAGAGDPGAIAAAHGVPIWAFHGGKDTAILPERSRELIAALKAAGGTPKYTEYAGHAHGQVIARAYSERELLPWLFKQKRK